MSRLKLKRFKVAQPSPSVLAHYVREYHSHTLHFDPGALPPITSRVLFGSDRPLVFDLGCGRGDFIVGEAMAHPDQHFVGFDFHWKSLWKSIERVHAAGLDNVRFIRADFRRALLKVPDDTVSALYLLFPPPATFYNRPKADTLNPASLATYHRILEPGAPFHFVTDNTPYFEEKLALIESGSAFEVVHVARQFEGGQTWFQQFWESLEIESKRLEARKRPQPPIIS